MSARLAWSRLALLQIAYQRPPLYWDIPMEGSGVGIITRKDAFGSVVEITSTRI